MFIEVLIISLIYSKVNNRKINNLEKIDFKYWYLIVLGFLVQLISIFLISKYNNSFIILLRENFNLIHILGYVLVLTGILFNHEYKGFKFMALGMFLNLIPIIFNGGRMPVDSEAIIRSGLLEQFEILKLNQSLTHVMATNKTRFKILIDFIAIPRPYILPKVISIGDIFLGIGLFRFITEYTKD